jgi:hypothetical protein
MYLPIYIVWFVFIRSHLSVAHLLLLLRSLPYYRGAFPGIDIPSKAAWGLTSQRRGGTGASPWNLALLPIYLALLGLSAVGGAHSPAALCVGQFVAGVAG